MLLPSILCLRILTNSRCCFKKYSDKYLTRINQLRRAFWLNWGTWRRTSRNPWGIIKINWIYYKIFRKNKQFHDTGWTQSDLHKSLVSKLMIKIQGKNAIEILHTWCCGQLFRFTSYITILSVPYRLRKFIDKKLQKCSSCIFLYMEEIKGT